MQRHSAHRPERNLKGTSMAKAKRIDIGFTDRRDVVLTLTAEEASFLRQITNRISGSPTESARCYSDSIGDALMEANVAPATYPVTGLAYSNSPTGQVKTIS